MTVVPYKDKASGKKEQVAEMFDSISPKYDLLNHLLSLGIDIRWRKKAIKKMKSLKPKAILDIATGTGDFALEALKLQPDSIIGIDISQGMLDVGIQKMKKKGVDSVIKLMQGDSENLPFDTATFDAVIVSFGVRNFENLEKGLSEIHRVLKPGGMTVILEFSKPTLFPFRQLYGFYFHYILPGIGKLISRDRSAYTYLPESVRQFPDGKKFIAILDRLGFKDTSCTTLTLGISSIYTGTR